MVMMGLWEDCSSSNQSCRCWSSAISSAERPTFGREDVGEDPLTLLNSSVLLLRLGERLVLSVFPFLLVILSGRRSSSELEDDVVEEVVREVEYDPLEGYSFSSELDISYVRCPRWLHQFVRSNTQITNTAQVSAVEKWFYLAKFPEVVTLI